MFIKILIKVIRRTDSVVPLLLRIKLSLFCSSAKSSCLLRKISTIAIINCKTNDKQTNTSITMFNGVHEFLTTVSCFNCEKLLANCLNLN